MARRLPTTLALSLLIMAMPMSSAQAIFATGACVFTLTFEFETRIRSATTQLTKPNYTVSGGQAVGPVKSCLIPISTLDPLKDTGMVGHGNSTIWTCESTVGGGTWDQGWEGAIPSVENGAHKIAGGWGAWEMVLWDLTPVAYVGTMKLTVHPDDATKLSTCLSSGIRSLKMIGAMVFQDP